MSPKNVSGAAVAPSPPSDLRSRFAVTIPVWPVGDDGRCTCSLHPDCKRPGKHADPRAPKDSPAYAVVTGSTDRGGAGVLVIDPDIKGGVDGLEQLAQLEKTLGTLGDTFEVTTPSGGAHVYVLHPGPRINGKLASAIDLKGDRATDDGLVYVIGPGSPGYEKTDDPAVVKPADAYEVAVDGPVLPLPDAWLGHVLTLATGTRDNAFAPTPIDETHPRWTKRHELGTKAAKEMAPSKADGQGGKALFAVCLRLVRGLELPVETALSLIEEHFNPRCTDPDGNPYTWTTDEIFHKLEDARDKSDLPCGDADPTWLEKVKALGKRGREPKPPAEKSKKKIGANVSYEGERTKLSRTGLVQMLYKWPDWDGVFWFDVLKRRRLAIDPPVEGELDLERGELSNADLATIAHWLDAHGFIASKEMVADAIGVVTKAPDRQKNEIAEYFDSLPQVTEAKVLTTLATDVFGCTDPFDNVLVMKTLVAAARRARHPGSFHKAMLVLKGAQQCGKTPAVKILAGDWYHSTGNGDITEDMTKLACVGNLLVEIEELSALKKDRDSLKAAISADSDMGLNVKYEREPQTYPRSFVFVGTTNKESFLSDPSGDSRYWTVPVGKIDLERLKELRDKIWAEADFLARSRYSNELDEAEKKMLNERQGVFKRENPFQSQIETWLEKDGPKHTKDGVTRVDVTLVWTKALRVVTGSSAPSEGDQTRIEECLQAIGFTKKGRKEGRPRIDGRLVSSSWWERASRDCSTAPRYLLSGRDASADDVLKSCRETCVG